MRALQELLPNERLVYYGDTAHLPYGDKSPALIRSYCADITDFLLRQPVKAIVIACNTASALAFDLVKEKAGDIPVFNVISPASRYALSVSRNLHIGVIGTKATIHSGIYGKLLRQYAVQPVKVVEKATPLLVPMIEEGWLHNNVSQDVIDAYLSDTGFAEIDSLILGCTHYPLIKKQIEAYFAKNQQAVTVVDSSVAVAESVRRELSEMDLLNTQAEIAPSLFYLSDFSQDFQASAKLFLGREITFLGC